MRANCRHRYFLRWMEKKALRHRTERKIPQSVKAARGISILAAARNMQRFESAQQVADRKHIEIWLKRQFGPAERARCFMLREHRPARLIVTLSNRGKFQVNHEMTGGLSQGQKNRQVKRACAWRSIDYGSIAATTATTQLQLTFETCAKLVLRIVPRQMVPERQLLCPQHVRTQNLKWLYFKWRLLKQRQY